MDGTRNKKTRFLIELSRTVEEADEVINKRYGFSSIGEKLAFLKGIFDEIEIVGHPQDNPEDAYRTMLLSIINQEY